MDIRLPRDVETSIESAVQSGHFASVEDALVEAWRAFQLGHAPVQSGEGGGEMPRDPILGSMSDHADLMDKIVEDAMRHRERQPWRVTTGE